MRDTNKAKEMTERATAGQRIRHAGPRRGHASNFGT